MSTSARLRRAFRPAAMIGLLVLGMSSVTAKAENGSAWLPPAQYASLPTATKLKEPSATGSLPSTLRLVSRTPVNFYTSVSAGKVTLRETTPTRCLPGKLLEVIADVSAKFGRISLESTHRSIRRNRRVGGAEHSLHIACRAVDFRIHDRTRGVMAYLRSRPEVGGLKMYRNGIIHIDNGSRRSW